MDEQTWPPMIWIGGAQGAGKSTLARNLSRARDLPSHAIDLWTYDHAARLRQPDTLDDERAWPEAAADAFDAYMRTRLDLVVRDVTDHGLDGVPALVEGPQLNPRLVTDLPPAHGVWLVPDPSRTRRAREDRQARIDEPASRPASSGYLPGTPSLPNGSARRPPMVRGLWRAAVGFTELPAYTFACECGRSGCAATWAGTPDDYDARTAEGPLLAAEHNHE